MDCARLSLRCTLGLNRGGFAGGGKAMRQTGVHPMPERFVFPIRARLGLEEDRQELGVHDLPKRHTARRGVKLGGQTFVAPACGGGNDGQPARALRHARLQRFPKLAPLPDVNLVRENEGGRRAVLRAPIRGHRLQRRAVAGALDRLRCVMGVIKPGHGLKAPVLPDDLGRFAKADARLFAIRGGKDDLPGGHPFRAKQVQQRERGGERGLAVAARDHQEDHLHDAGALCIARAIDAPNDPLLPGRKLKGALRRGAGRVAQASQELHRPLARAQRVVDRRAVKDPGRIGALARHF